MEIRIGHYCIRPHRESRCWMLSTVRPVLKGKHAGSERHIDITYPTTLGRALDLVHERYLMHEDLDVHTVEGFQAALAQFAAQVEARYAGLMDVKVKGGMV